MLLKMNNVAQPVPFVWFTVMVSYGYAAPKTVDAWNGMISM